MKNGPTGIRSCLLLWFMYAVSTSCSSESSRGVALIDINTGSVERVHLSIEDWLVTVTADKRDSSQICMQSVRPIENEIRVDQERFLVIQSKQRGGTDFVSNRTTIICTSKSRLHVAFDIVSMERFHVTRSWVPEIDERKVVDEYRHYLAACEPITFDSDRQRYLLRIHVVDTVTSKQFPDQNYSMAEDREFIFDEASSTFKDVSKNQTGETIGEGQTPKWLRQTQTRSPEWFVIGKSTFVYENNIWYGVGASDSLRVLSSQCR